MFRAPSRACIQCGHSQVHGDVCEVCGIKLAPAGDSEPSSQPAPPLIADSAAPRETGFFGKLFDFSFESFITPSIIKILYVLIVIVIGFGLLGLVIGAFLTSPVLGILALIIGVPVFGFLCVLFLRVWLEIVVVLFRIEKHAARIGRRDGH